MLQYVRRFPYFKISFSAKSTLFKNDIAISNGRWCPKWSPIGSYLLFRFLQPNEQSKLSSAENSLTSCPIAANSTLLSLDEKNLNIWHAVTQAHMSDGLLSLMDSWFYSWWLRIACSVYAKRYKNLSIYSSVILSIPVFWVTPYTNPSWCRFFFISGQCYGYPLIPYRDTNIPCYLGCCFEVLSFAAYPGYPLVPYRETNIPCYLGCCFEGTVFRSVPWVSPSTLPGY